MNNKIWADVIPKNEKIVNKIKKLYKKARNNGHNNLEISAALHKMLDLAIYEAELDEAFGE